jgi:hypothetical protein
MPRHRHAVAIAVITLLVIVATAAPGYDAPAQRMDDGALLLYPELVLKGWMPYRDFETYYGPASPYFLAPIFALFGPGILVTRTVGLVYHIAVLAAIFGVVRSRGIVLGLGAILIAHLFLLPTGLAPFPWLGALACALWSIVLAANSTTPSKMGFAGLLAAGALLYRPDLTPAVTLSAGILLFFQVREMRLSFLLGFVAGLIPMLLLCWAAGIHNVFDNLFRYPVLVITPARKLPWSSLAGYLTCLVALMLIAALTNVGTGLLALWRNRASRANHLFAAAAVLALGTSHQALQRLDAGHITLCCFLPLALLPVALAIMVDHWLGTASSFVRPLVLVALPLFLVSALASPLVQVVGQRINPSAKRGAIFVEHQGRSFPVSSFSVARETANTLDQITTLAQPGERLFVGPADLRRTNYNDTFLYHLLPQLIPATYFLEMNPLSANRPESRLSADILTADWLILDHRLDEWNEPNESSRFGTDAPNQVVQSNFALQARHGAYDLYHKKPAASLRP